MLCVQVVRIMFEMWESANLFCFGEILRYAPLRPYTVVCVDECVFSVYFMLERVRGVLASGVEYIYTMPSSPQQLHTLKT